MYLTPFEHFIKSASTEALVPGGPPGMPGVNAAWGDSDGAEASNSDIALLRQQQNAAPILATPDADGGAGYSHPPAGVSPNVQAHQDVKMAMVIREAEAFADLCYNDIKQAGTTAKRVYDAAGRAGRATVDAARGAAQFAGDVAAPYAAQARQDMGRLGDWAGQKAAPAMAAGREGVTRLGEAREALMGRAPRTPLQHLDAAGGLGGIASAKASEIWSHASDRMAQAQAGASEAMGKAQQYVQNGVSSAMESARAHAAQHPYAAAGIGVGVLGAGGVGAGVMMNRAAEQQKAAALQEASEMGRAYALQQLGLL